MNWIMIAIFLCLGFFALLLPIVPQAIFFAIALILIAFEVPSVEKFIEGKVSKNSEIGKIYYNVKEKVEKYLKF